MRPASCGLATMESDNGILCRTGRVVETDVNSGNGNFGSGSFGFGSFGSFGFGGFSGFGFGGGSPIVLDVAGVLNQPDAGIKITPLSSSNTFFDMTGSGRRI